MFLSVKYHVIYPNYIYDKLNELRNSYQLKVLLVLVDHIEFQSSLKELTKLAIRTNCTLMLAWSYEEAANYLENYKLFAERTPDIIMGKLNANSDVSQTPYQCLVEAFTSIKSINKTDAVSLISTFDTFENIVKTDEEELTLCPGMASLKV
jgi:DNA excision repair protein ERCC-1